MSCRTVELDPEDVLLEAWSKWDLYGTGKIEEKKLIPFNTAKRKTINSL